MSKNFSFKYLSCTIENQKYFPEAFIGLIDFPVDLTRYLFKANNTVSDFSKIIVSPFIKITWQFHLAARCAPNIDWAWQLFDDVIARE